jgi:hypothetical protein
VSASLQASADAATKFTITKTKYDRMAQFFIVVDFAEQLKGVRDSLLLSSQMARTSSVSAAKPG